MRTKIILIFLLMLTWTVALHAAGSGRVAVYEVTASRLNVRESPSVKGRILGSYPRGTHIKGETVSGSSWIKITFASRPAYVHSDYLKFTGYPEETTKVSSSSSNRSRSRGFRLGLGGWLLIIFVGIPFARGLLGGLFEVLIDIIGEVGIFYIIFYIGFLPFRILNWLQMFTHKPWRILQRHSWASEKVKPLLRVMNFIAMIPLYIVLTPLRLINAVAFNMILRPVSEFWSYLGEVISPSDTHEGYRDFLKWIYMLPFRILKYPVYHGALTIIECTIMTVVDTIYPAVTLYHGTSGRAADAIVISPERSKDRRNSSCRTDGIWNVGGGNYAGDGIYFAPRSRTSRHYARRNIDPVLIICRVSLGRILPLSLAPDAVYYSAGNANAHSVTSYGLKNGYASIEWWRKDTGWWEYCLLDWQNKYNESWRIRPITVMNMNSHFFKRIDGGSRHWLFDRMILRDIGASVGGGL